MLIEKDRPLTRFEKVRVIVESIPLLVGGIGVVAGLLFLLQATIRYGAKTFWYLGQVLGRRPAEFVLVFLVWLFAALAYALKQRHQGWYGLTEIVFGAVSAANIAFSIVPGSSTLPEWVGLFGCTYIIVRGLSNASEALDRKIKAATGTDNSAAPPTAPSTS